MKTNTKKVVVIGILTAIVIALQFVSMAIRFGTFSITLSLVPIVVGAALYGPLAGGWLGLAFGVAVLISGDAAQFLAIDVFGTIAIVLVKGCLSGLFAGIAYKLIEKKNKPIATIIAAIISPITNTGVFIAGCYIFFQDWLVGAFGTLGFATVVGGLVTINFAIELGVNLVLLPTITQIIKIGKKQLK